MHLVSRIKVLRIADFCHDVSTRYSIICIIYISPMNTIDNTYATIKARLIAGEWKSGERLPSLAQLAKQYAVSRTTMWRAVGRLQHEGVVHARMRGAIIAGSVKETRPAPAPALHPWELLKKQIAQGILLGTIPTGPLPPICKQALQHGVAIDTMKKALTALVCEGILIQEGRCIRPARTAYQYGTTTAILISQGAFRSGISIGEVRTERVVEAFERESSRLSIVPRSEGFDPFHPSALIELRATIEATPRICGFVVNFWKPWDEAGFGRWLDLLRYLCTTRLPIVLIDQSGATEFPSDITANRFVRILRIAGVSAGERVADFLIAKGHLQIAYLTPMENVHWSQNRSRCLRQRLQKYGNANADIKVFGPADAADTNDLVLAILGLGPTGIERLYRERLSTHERGDLVQRLTQENFQSLRAAVARGKPAATLHALAAFLSRLADRPHDPAIFDAILEALIHNASNTAGIPHLNALFERVYRESTATVWVCSDDKTGIRAVEFLRRKGRKVPENISVFGFENWRESHEMHLSTYDFNMPGMVQQALLMILDEKARKARPAVSEVEGFVVERRTTRR